MTVSKVDTAPLKRRQSKENKDEKLDSGANSPVKSGGNFYNTLPKIENTIITEKIHDVNIT